MPITCDEKTAKQELFSEGLSGGASQHRVIAYTHQWDGGQGMLPYGVVVAFNPNKRPHPYVTWRVAKSDNQHTYGQWFAESGHYFDNFTDAADDYRERGGK